MHACDIKFAVINVCGTCLISAKTTNIYTLELYTRYNGTCFHTRGFDFSHCKINFCTFIDGNVYAEMRQNLIIRYLLIHIIYLATAMYSG